MNKPIGAAAAAAIILLTTVLGPLASTAQATPAHSAMPQGGTVAFTYSLPWFQARAIDAPALAQTTVVGQPAGDWCFVQTRHLRQPIHLGATLRWSRWKTINILGAPCDGADGWWIAP